MATLIWQEIQIGYLSKRLVLKPPEGSEEVICTNLENVQSVNREAMFSARLSNYRLTL
jgi:ribosomal protein L32E